MPPAVIIGTTRDLAAVKRIETAARVKVNVSPASGPLGYKVTANSEADAQRFREAAERLDLYIRT